MAFKILYPVTSEKAEALRANLAAMGARKARVKMCRNGSCRVNIATVEDRAAARDALVLSNVCTAGGDGFTNPDSVHAWNSPVEIFVRFLDK
jgi:hypothetical protein